MPGVLFLHPDNSAAFSTFPLFHERCNFSYLYYNLFVPLMIVVTLLPLNIFLKYICNFRHHSKRNTSEAVP